MHCRKFAAASLASFTVFFSHLSTILAKAFERSNVVKGWSDAGIYDHETGGCNIERILGCWNPGGQNPNSSWRTMSADGRAYILAAIPILAEIGMQKGEISDEEVDNCLVSLEGKRTLTIKEVMHNEGASLVPDYMKLQDPDKVIDVGKGINLRRVILITNKCWLDAAKRSRALRGAGAIKFDPAKCLCGSTQQNPTSHIKVKKHDKHVTRLVEALRLQASNGDLVLKFADETIVDLNDAGLVLARAQFASLAAGQAAEAPLTAEEIQAMMEEHEREREEDVRLSDLDAHTREMVGINEDTEILLEDSASECSDDDAAADDSGSEEEDELSSGQEQLLIENNLTGAMTGGDDY
jgi:hypothetical protein